MVIAFKNIYLYTSLFKNTVRQVGVSFNTSVFRTLSNTYDGVVCENSENDFYIITTFAKELDQIYSVST